MKKVQTTTTTTTTLTDRINDGNDDDDADKKDGDVGDERNNTKKEEEEQKENNNEEEEESKKSKSVYVANLTWWTSDKQIEQLASEFGITKSIQFFTEKKNGKSKGCAIVEFTSSQSALLCEEKLNKRAIDGKACVVPLAPVGTAHSAVSAEYDDDAGAPLGPPPDTAWKGPVPTKGGGGQGATASDVDDAGAAEACRSSNKR